MTREEVAARIKAARLLRAMSQGELARRLAEAGLPWRLAGALERCEVELRSAHVAALAAALELPPRWFTDDEVSDLVPDFPTPDIAGRYEVMIGLLERILTRLDDLAG